MEQYRKAFARLLAETGALFFDKGLVLKDGRPTPYFVNMGGFRTGKLNYELGGFFAELLVRSGLLEHTDVILGPSYKGSAIACATTNALWLNHRKELLFEYDRKEAKTHGEASASKSLFVNGCFTVNRNIVIVDDVGTSMATKYELVEKIENEAALKGVELRIRAVVLGIDREQTTAVYDQAGNVLLGVRGSDAADEFASKTGIEVHRICGIRDIVEYLFKERIPVTVAGRMQALDDPLKQEFDRYLDVYGTRSVR
ncbi:MAG: hypothetical protein HY788_05255 [Deltaproteobacteria bacterium]|nr:hypothetical protein [Deltaproteobacteria bacterium]